MDRQTEGQMYVVAIYSRCAKLVIYPVWAGFQNQKNRNK